jgi:CheY-like chemotaxis protein
MPSEPPLETMAGVKAASPETAVLILTAHKRDAYLASVLAVGAAGFIIKDEAPERLVTAVQAPPEYVDYAISLLLPQAPWPWRSGLWPGTAHAQSPGARYCLYHAPAFASLIPVVTRLLHVVTRLEQR